MVENKLAKISFFEGTQIRKVLVDNKNNCVFAE